MCATRYYKPKTQSNHDSYIIPDTVQEFTGKPLYLLIAYWGLKRGTPICQNQVSEVFGLTRKRAEQMMFYAHRKQGTVNSNLKLVKEEPQNTQKRKLMLFIYSVTAEVPKLEKETRPRAAKKMPHEDRELWRQLLVRPIGSLLKTTL